MFSQPELTPYYPSIRDSTYSDEKISVIESNNVLKSAIKQNRYVPVNDTVKVNNNAATIFSEVVASNSLSITDLYQDEFHLGLETLIKQFTCELYASQQSADTIQVCPQSQKIVDNNLGYLPFEDGVRRTERLVSVVRNAQETLELEFFLKSSNERSLESLWGAVHELGAFKDSQLDETNLVLTINLQAYKKPSENATWRQMNPDPLVFFVVLPTVDQLVNRPNEIESMNFAYRSAKLLLVDSR